MTGSYPVSLAKNRLVRVLVRVNSTLKATVIARRCFFAKHRLFAWKLSHVSWRHSSIRFMPTWWGFVAVLHDEKPVWGSLGLFRRQNRIENRTRKRGLILREADHNIGKWSFKRGWVLYCWTFVRDLFRMFRSNNLTSGMDREHWTVPLGRQWPRTELYSWHGTYLRRFEWIIRGEVNIKEEHPSLVDWTWRAIDGGAPFVQIVAFGTSTEKQTQQINKTEQRSWKSTGGCSMEWLNQSTNEGINKWMNERARNEWT